VPSKSAKPQIAAFREAELPFDLEEILGQAMLEKLFTVRVRRQVRLIRATKETLIEMSIDSGTISGGGKKSTVDEVELELKEGNLSDLLDYAAKAAALVPIFTGSMSKYARGMALTGRTEGMGETRPAPEFDLEEDYSAAFKKQFMYFGSKILEEAAAFAGEGPAREADRIFLAPFTALRDLAFWVSPMVETIGGIRENLDAALVPLQKLKDAKDILERWKKLKRHLAKTMGEDRLGPVLERQVKAASDEVARQIAKGTYTAVIYAVWAALEKDSWTAEEYLTAKKLFQCRTSVVLEKLSQGIRIKENLPALVRLDRAGKKARPAELGKKERKCLKKLAKKMSELDAAMRLLRAVPEKAVASKTCAVCRQAGVLTGWLMNEEKGARDKAVSAFVKMDRYLKKMARRQKTEPLA